MDCSHQNQLLVELAAEGGHLEGELRGSLRPDHTKIVYPTDHFRCVIRRNARVSEQILGSYSQVVVEVVRVSARHIVEEERQLPTENAKNKKKKRKIFTALNENQRRLSHRRRSLHSVSSQR